MCYSAIIKGKLSLIIAATGLLLSACNINFGSSSNSSTTTQPQADADVIAQTQTDTDAATLSLTDTDVILQTLIQQQNLQRSPIENRVIPDISSPLAQLGKKLFFTQGLGGNFDSACVSCHHPSLAGADALSLPIGVDAINPHLLGPGRENATGIPRVPRNSQTVFNVALWDSGLFWDSRIESLSKQNGQNGSGAGISTPDSGFTIADVNAGPNLVSAQARFPVTSVEEMRSQSFETGNDNDSVRNHLAARIGDYNEGAGELALNTWLTEFQTAFASNSSAETLITYNNIALAISEYQRSMVFINSPWRQYVEGNIDALTEAQKQGAILFFNPPNQGGADCNACHNGPLFSDEQHHVVAFPQIGTGKGNGIEGEDDFGRENITGSSTERYHFRTPSLLNIATTAPYGHTGTFATLARVLDHYDNPTRSIDDFSDNQEWCSLAQFSSISNCVNLYPNTRSFGNNALNQLRIERQNGSALFQNINLNNTEKQQLLQFLNALTDPCINDMDCIAPWIADPQQDNHDGLIIEAVNSIGDNL